MPKLKSSLLILLSTFELPSTAGACPFCYSDTAKKVRDNIFDSDFTFHLLAALAPFPILAGILLFIYYGPPASVQRLLGK